jgi:hypothetical protein
MFNPFKKATKLSFRFKEPEDTACITCTHVLNKQNPILYVIHDKDGSWQFLCGQNNHTEANAKVISLKQIVAIDETINDLFEMPLGVGVERKSRLDNWIPFRT